jgi:8-oxo-dGTP pyrophosphatase MutT (NUDIX family)
MSLRCIEAARHFRRALHLRFVIAGQPVGWVRARDVPLLTRWPDVFKIGSDALVLSSAFETVDSRSAALGAVIGALAAQGCIPGWRNETYAIRNAFDDAPLALIERAASRFFGTMTFAVHVNGIVGPADAQQASGAMPHFWIARRSDKKATDPGMLDNLVGGGIGWGLSIGDTLVKECYEESGIDETLARTAVAGRVVHVLQEIDEGTQAEQLFVHDLLLPDDFPPVARCHPCQPDDGRRKPRVARLPAAPGLARCCPMRRL